GRRSTQAVRPRIREVPARRTAQCDPHADGRRSFRARGVLARGTHDGRLVHEPVEGLAMNGQLANWRLAIGQRSGAGSSAADFISILYGSIVVRRNATGGSLHGA